MNERNVYDHLVTLLIRFSRQVIFKFTNIVRLPIVVMKKIVINYTQCNKSRTILTVNKLIVQLIKKSLTCTIRYTILQRNYTVVT